MAPPRRPSFRPFRTSLLTALAVALVGGPLAVGACKKDTGPTCNPDEENFETFRLVVGPAEQINLDTEGSPRATVLRVYQLTDDRILDTITFEDVWKDAAAAFGDIMLDEQEFIVYPGKPEVHEIKPNPDAKFLAAAAIFREPVGNTWVADWNVPQYHGNSACAAKKNKQPFGDPCFYVSVELNELDGGHKPPVNFNGEGLSVVCPGPPLLIPPPAELSKKDKKKKEREEKRKKRREKLKKGAEDTKEGAEKAQETNDQAGAASDAATTKPEAPAVPGKD